MKLNVVFTCLLLSSALCTLGQSSDKEAIHKLLNQIASAIKKSDINTMGKIYAKDFIFTSATGKMYNKAERLEMIKSTPPPKSFNFSNEKIRFYGNTAIIHIELETQPKDQALEHDLVTIVMVKSGGQWQEVTAQGTIKSGQ
ncbi:MAG: hypothetical protein NVS1B13_18740 [Flavisolibacter sp.]